MGQEDCPRLLAGLALELLHIKPATNQKSLDVVAFAEIAGNGKAVVKGIHDTGMKRGVVAATAAKINIGNSTIELELVTHHAAQ